MVETPIHTTLKTIAFEKLIEMDFDESEIKKEYSLRIGEHNYTVDVVGLRGREDVAIECETQGYPSDERIVTLKSVFAKVIILTPIDLIRYYKMKIRRCQKKIMELEKQLGIKHTREIKIYCKDETTRERLKKIKAKLGARSYEEALRELIKMHEKEKRIIGFI